MTQRLTTLVVEINTRFPELSAYLQDWSETPRRKAKGRRYFTYIGKTRFGKRLIIEKRLTRERLHIHNALDPYRRNSDVVAWMKDYAEARPKAMRTR